MGNYETCDVKYITIDNAIETAHDRIAETINASHDTRLGMYLLELFNLFQDIIKSTPEVDVDKMIQESYDKGYSKGQEDAELFTRHEDYDSYYNDFEKD